MELTVVTPPDYFEGEGILINQFFAEGLDLLHIRKPKSDAAQFRKLMMEIKPEYYPAISIHQHHDLADEFSLKRLHYTELHRKSVKTAELDGLCSRGFCLSSSIHELDALKETVKLHFFDYVFFGPVFDSISKAGYQSILEPDFVLPPHPVRVFAIGGVRTDRLRQLKRMNFDGAAVLGSLWHQPHTPLTVLKKLKEAINELKDGHR
jgi:thiamine-phosphate pyrophosphorylase